MTWAQGKEEMSVVGKLPAKTGYCKTGLRLKIALLSHDFIRTHRFVVFVAGSMDNERISIAKFRLNGQNP
jgi:hypothetical protein